MEILKDPEELIFCPLDKAHYIQRKRMAFHLVKCRKNHPGQRIVNCDFNSNHKVLELERQYHHENCEDRKDMEIAVFQESGSDLSKYPILNTTTATEDSWDDCNESSYDPSTYTESHNVLRKLDVQPPSKKKNFRVGERHRIREKSDALSTESRQGPSTSKGVSRKKSPKKPIILPEIGQTEDITEADEDETRVVSDLMAKIKLSAGKAYVQKVDEKDK